MKKLASIFLAMVILVSFCTFTGCSKEDKTLNIFTWEAYIPQNVIDDFTAETGIVVNYSNFESNEEMLAKLQAAKGGTYDLIVASDYIIDIAVREGGLVGEIDKSKIPNYSNISPDFQSQYYDPDNLYTVPYVAGTPLIVYNPDMVDFEIKGISDLWDESLEDSVCVLDDSRNTIGMVNLSLGYSLNETDDAKLKNTRERLMALSKNIRAFDNDTPQNLLISGEVAAAYMFTPNVVEALAANENFKVVYPEEGMGFGIDSFFMAANAPHKDNAYAFLNFVLDAERGAHISEEVEYICTNAASYEYLSSDSTENQALYIPSEVLGNAEFMMDVGEKTTVYDEMWTEFKQMFN